MKNNSLRRWAAGILVGLVLSFASAGFAEVTGPGPTPSPTISCSPAPDSGSGRTIQPAPPASPVVTSTQPADTPAVSPPPAAPPGNTIPVPADSSLQAPPQTISLDLDKTVELAVTRNPSLIVSQAAIKEAQGRYEQARSGLGFKLNGSATYIRMDPIAEFQLPGENGKRGQVIRLGTENNYDFRVVLSKIITTFGSLENTVAAAALQIDAQRWLLETTRQQVSFQAKNDYFNALEATAMVGVARENLDIARQQLKLSNDLFSAGVVPRYDVIRSESNVARAQQLLVIAENGRDLAMATLRNTLSFPQNTTLILEDERDVVLVDVDEEKAQATAIKNRPEVNAAYVSYKALERLLIAARRSNLPVLALNATYEEKNPAGLASIPRTFTESLVLQVPLLDAGERDAKVKQAEAALESFQGTLEQLLQGVQLEVKQAVLNLNEIKARMDTARKEVETTREGYAIARTRYENGLSTQLELDDAQRALNTAQINYLNILYEYNTALARLERVLGVSWKGVVQDESSR